MGLGQRNGLPEGSRVDVSGSLRGVGWKNDLPEGLGFGAKA